MTIASINGVARCLSLCCYGDFAGVPTQLITGVALTFC